MATRSTFVTACLPVIYSGGSGVNPGDSHIPLGEWSAGTGWNTRCLLKAPLSFSGMVTINEARLYLYQHTAAGYHAKGTGAVTVDTRRKTSDWSESSGGSGTGTDEVWGGSSGTLVTAGYYDDFDGVATPNNGSADGTLIAIPITQIVRRWFDGSANYGLMVFATGSAQADAVEFYSRRASGRVPYIWIDYDTNRAPNAPVNMSPTGGEVVHTGRTVSYFGTHSDPDGGLMAAYEMEVWNEDRTVRVQEWGSPVSAASFSPNLTLPDGYNADRVYMWRARTMDPAGAWGPWSIYSGFRPNTAPLTPAAPTVDVDSLTPTITGTFADPDPGDTPSLGGVEVERVSPAATVWSTETPITASPWSIVYAGPALAFGTAYRARVRAADARGAWSAWSAWAPFTPTAPTGPDNLTPRSTATKQNSLTPTLTVGHSVAFVNDEYEVYAGPSTGSTRLVAKAWTGSNYAAATSKPYTYGGTALVWGATYYWRARVRLGDLSETGWSGLVPFYVNAEPTTPTNLRARDAAGAAHVDDGGGVSIVQALTPYLEAVYTDPDLGGYNDRPTSRTVEVYVRNTDGSAGAVKVSRTLASPPYSVPMGYVYDGPVLVAGQSYLFRWRFVDNAGRTSPWSGYATFRVTTPPTVALVSPADGSTVITQRPVLDWSYVSSAGKPQVAYQVRIYDRGPAAGPVEVETLAHDSGLVQSGASSYQVPNTAGGGGSPSGGSGSSVLANDRAYRWTVTVYDSEQLSATLS